MFYQESVRAPKRTDRVEAVEGFRKRRVHGGPADGLEALQVTRRGPEHGKNVLERQRQKEKRHAK